MVSPNQKRPNTADDLDHGKGAKRQKGTKDVEPGSTRQSDRNVDHEGNVYWELAERRRVTIAEFRKETKVNIREYYEQDGKMLPGKKGIALSLDQFRSLLRVLPDILDALNKKGHSIEMPGSLDDLSPAPVETSDEEREP